MPMALGYESCMANDLTNGIQRLSDSVRRAPVAVFPFFNVLWHAVLQQALHPTQSLCKLQSPSSACPLAGWL